MPDTARGLSAAQVRELQQIAEENYRQWSTNVEVHRSQFNPQGTQPNSRLSNFARSVQESIRHRVYREHYVQHQLGPSFLSMDDDVNDMQRIAIDGPIRVRWDQNLDDIGATMMEMSMKDLNKILEFDNSSDENGNEESESNDANPVPIFIDGIPTHMYQPLRDNLVQLQETVSSLTWGKRQDSVGGCHFDYGDGFLCRVSRWDAAPDIESGRLSGRLQCWTDDLELDEDFLQVRPEFRVGTDLGGANGAYFLGAQGHGEHCLLEVANAILVTGSEVDHDYVFSNVLGQLSSHGEGGWLLSDFFEEHQADLTVPRIVQEMVEFAVDAACSWGTCPNDETTADATTTTTTMAEEE